MSQQNSAIKKYFFIDLSVLLKLLKFSNEKVLCSLKRRIED